MRRSQYFITSVLAGMALCGACANPSGGAESADRNSARAGTAHFKSGAAVEFSHDFSGKADPGASGDFTLVLREYYEAGNLEVLVSTDDGLELYATSLQASFDMADADTHEMDIYFAGAPQGLYYININAIVSLGDGMTSVRTRSIPVQVGNVAANAQKQTANIETGADGEKMIIMDAEEDIR